MTKVAGILRPLIAAAIFAIAPAAWAAPGAPLVWAFGDSLTAGAGVPRGQGFTDQLEAALRRSGIRATVRNGGVSGETAGQGLARLDRGLVRLGAKPDLVIVEFGTNDLFRRRPIAAIRADLDAILARLRARRIAVVLAGTHLPDARDPYARAVSALYPPLARRHGASLYPVFLAGVAGNPRLNQPDGLHPNPQGVATIVARILPVVKRALH